MGLDACFYEANEENFTRNQDGTIEIVPSVISSLRVLAYFRKWYNLSDFIYEIWQESVGGTDMDDFNNTYVLLDSYDLDRIEEHAHDYDDEADRVTLLATVALLRAAINNGKYILYNNDW